MVPADGATVRTPPAAVQLVFNEAIDGQFRVVVVTAPSGARVSARSPQVSRAVVRQPLAPLPVAGRYVVTYRVVSADGHVVANRTSFTYAPAGNSPGTPTAGAPASPPNRPSTSPSASPALPPPPTADGEGDGSRAGATVAVSASVAGVLAIAGALHWRRRRAADGPPSRRPHPPESAP